MKLFKWVTLLIILTILGSFLHYTLPQHDIGRVVGTYQKRQDFNDWTKMFWNDSGDSTNSITRDVQFIQVILPDGTPMVYRNQDTGWGWPPYFKFNTATLQAEVTNLTSTADNPKWVLIKHYGWRNEFLSIFPNAITISQVSGPNEKVIPYFNIVFLSLASFLILYLAVKIKRFGKGLKSNTPAI